MDGSINEQVTIDGETSRPKLWAPPPRCQSKWQLQLDRLPPVQRGTRVFVQVFPTAFLHFDIVYHLWLMQIWSLRDVDEESQSNSQAFEKVLALPCNPTSRAAALIESNRICCLGLAPGKAPIVPSRQHINMKTHTPPILLDSVGLARLGATWDAEAILGQTRLEPRHLSCLSLPATNLPSCPDSGR